MKVLILSDDFLPTPGGIAIFVCNLCIQLGKDGYQVDILTCTRAESELADENQFYRLSRYSLSRRLSSLVPVVKTLRLHQKNRYDVVFIGHFMTTHALGALVLRWLWGVPYVILSHGNDLRYSVSTRTDAMVAHWLLGHAALMLGNSHYTIQCLREIGYKGKAEVLNPGVDVVQFHPGVITSDVRQRYGLDGHQVLLTTARLVAKKNVEGVLRALPQVIEQVPNVLYLVAGGGEERERLERLCDELRLRSQVRFLGHVENRQLPGLYCASDLFVMPSYEVKGSGDIETFGISFVEANACGLPVIGGRSGGTVDAVIDGETGLLVDPYDVDAISTAIIRVLTDRALARRLGENGRRRVERELSWDRVGERLERYLESVVRER